jgi:hypothetical protein
VENVPVVAECLRAMKKRDRVSCGKQLFRQRRANESVSAN